jgi:ubiquinone/menaquinone biosynthesis C-methylase UbiE
VRSRSWHPTRIAFIDNNLRDHAAARRPGGHPRSGARGRTRAENATTEADRTNTLYDKAFDVSAARNLPPHGIEDKRWTRVTRINYLEGRHGKGVTSGLGGLFLAGARPSQAEGKIMRWYVKATIQYVLSKMPGGMRVNEALSRRMGEQARLREHATDRLGVLLRLVQMSRQHIDFTDEPTAVEIGTGWAPLLPMLLGLAGARVHTFDINRFLVPENIRTTLTILRAHAAMTAAELGTSEETIIRTIDSAAASANAAGVAPMLEPFNVTYSAPTDATALPVDDGSADIYVSNLVMAHIPPEVLPRLLAEMRRVLKDGGIAAHRIRMSDELAGADPRSHDMNFLKFSSSFWNRFANTRIKYNNRLRCSQYKQAFGDAGFQLLESKETISKTGLAGLKSMKVAKEFQSFELEDLATSLMVAVWKKMAPVPARSADTAS